MRRWLAAIALTACSSVGGVDVGDGSGGKGIGGSGGAGGTQGTAGGSSSGVATFCASLADAECSDALVAACALASPGACRAAATAACASGASDATFGRDLSTYAAPSATACLSTAKAAYEDGAVDATELVALERACDLAFSAKKPVGAPCAADVECDVANGLVCAASSGALACTLPGTKQKGAPCTPAAACAPELVCSASGTCADGGDLGAPCAAGAPCKSALRCVGDACAAKAKIGGACDGASACAVGYCVLVPTDASPTARLCLSKLAYANGSAICRAFAP